MKLFTQMDSTVRGKVVRCLVTDGEMVEHDTPVFIVEVV
jgi:biotin carboxyl carrier protein